MTSTSQGGRKSLKQPLSLLVAKVCHRNENERDFYRGGRGYVLVLVRILAGFGSEFWSSFSLLSSSRSSRSLNMSATAVASWVVVGGGWWLLWGTIPDALNVSHSSSRARATRASCSARLFGLVKSIWSRPGLN